MTPPSPRLRDALTWLLIVIGAAGLGLGLFFQATVPQRPDGDATAVAQFVARHGESTEPVRERFWYALSGAGLAWGALVRLARAVAGRRFAPIAALGWVGLLVALVGWGWSLSAGWEGELFLAEGDPVPLGPSARPVLRFDGFVVPPAPDGPGRALAMTLSVDGVAHEVSVTRPWRGAGWTVRPHWYGGVVTTASLGEPLYWGESGSREVRLVDGSVVRLTIDVEGRTGYATPTLRDDIVRVAHHAIVRARYAPGDPLVVAGGVVVLVALLLRVGAALYNVREARAVEEEV